MQRLPPRRAGRAVGQVLAGSFSSSTIFQVAEPDVARHVRAESLVRVITDHMFAISIAVADGRLIGGDFYTITAPSPLKHVGSGI